jgi:hypothetical protein
MSIALLSASWHVQEVRCTLLASPRRSQARCDLDLGEAGKLLD